MSGKTGGEEGRVEATNSKCNDGSLPEEKFVAAAATSQVRDESQAQEETKEDGRLVTVRFRGRFASEQVLRVQPEESVAELIHRLYA